MIEIDSDVPPPKAREGKQLGADGGYPFERMKPGDSFEIEGDVNAYNNVRTSAHRYGKRNRMRFSTRIMSGAAGDPVRKYRCWRIA